MSLDWAIAVLSVVAITLMIAALLFVYTRMLPAPPRVLLSLGCAAVGTLVWTLVAVIARPDLPAQLVIPVAALGGLAAFLSTIVVRASGTGHLGTLLFALGWSLLVFAPVALLCFAGLEPLGLRPIDQGGSLAINVATGASALGILLAAGAGAARLKPSALPRGLGTIGVITLCIGWIGWLVGAELAIDDLTAGILINGLAGAGGGVAGWLIVQRIRHQSSSLAAVAAGLVSGLVGVTAGAPMYAPFAAFVAGGLAAVAACLFTLWAVGNTRRQHWFIVGSHLIAGAVGVIVLGLFANDMGFLFTGQYVFLRDQVICTILVAAYSFGASIGLWHAVRRLPSRVAVPQVS